MKTMTLETVLAAAACNVPSNPRYGHKLNCKQQLMLGFSWT